MEKKSECGQHRHNFVLTILNPQLAVSVCAEL